MLNYSLVENMLTDRPDDYSAQTHSIATLDKEALINRILNKGTLLTRTDILAALNGFEESVAEALLEGYSLTLPLFNTSFSISGVFESPLDTFDGNRHKLNINLTKGTLLRKVEKEVKFEKTNAAAALPNIQEVKDSVSGTVNEKLTKRGVVEVRGYSLKIEGADAACGLWFVADSGAETKAEVLVENKPSRIIALIPDLPDGNYQVKVVTQFTGSGTAVKTPKVFVYQKILTVNP
jgi:nucleoid DNA-binding protein